MKADLYTHMVRAGLTRRRLLKGMASTGAVAAAGGVFTGSSARPVWAQDAAALRAEMLKIPGVGMGSPTDADWQKVGELALGGTRETVAEGEFAGVELTFMGLNNQNLHNFLFRGFLKPWEAYTGATINWIDLAQADYNARLQQSIATGTVDFDIVEMGAPFEGDVLGRGMASEMPDWVRDLIDMDDYVDYLKAPVGTWDGKTYRVSIDGDTHTFAYRTDYYDNAEFAEAWAAAGNTTPWAPPTTWEEVNAQSVFLIGKTDPLTGLDAHGYLDPLKGWGGFGFYFLENRAAPYAKHPDDPAWLFDPDTMKPRVNNPAFVQAIQDVMDLIEAGAYPADQINADPGTTAFQQFLAGTGGMLNWWGDVGSSARTSDTSVVGDVVGFDINPGSQKRLELADRRLGGDPQRLAQQRLYRLGHLRHGHGRRRRAEEEGGLVGGGASGRQGPVALGLGLSVGLPALPQQPLPVRGMGSGRLRPRLHRGLSRLEPRQLQPPQRRDRAAHPRHLPVLFGRRGRAGQGLRRAIRRRAGNRGCHRRRLGGHHRPDRPREPDRALQGLARALSLS